MAWISDWGKVMAILGKSLHFPGKEREGCGREGILAGMCLRDAGEEVSREGERVWRERALGRGSWEEDRV